MYQINISLAGAGRVAEALCKELFHAGYKIDKIASETKASGKLLADTCKAAWSSDLYFGDSTEIVIVAVPDHRLKSVLGNLKCAPGTLVVHTAGSFGLDIFPEHIKPKAFFTLYRLFQKEGRSTSLISLFYLNLLMMNRLQYSGNLWSLFMVKFILLKLSREEYFIWLLFLSVTLLITCLL
jgi:Uncharacterized conserved protein